VGENLFGCVNGAENGFGRCGHKVLRQAFAASLPQQLRVNANRFKKNRAIFYRSFHGTRLPGGKSLQKCSHWRTRGRSPCLPGHTRSPIIRASTEHFACFHPATRTGASVGLSASPVPCEETRARQKWGGWGMTERMRALRALLAGVVLIWAAPVAAQNATWSTTPGSGDFNTATN
jgi:hypothetical protein